MDNKKAKLYYRKEIHLIALAQLETFNQFIQKVSKKIANLPKQFTMTIEKSNGTILNDKTFTMIKQCPIEVIKIMIHKQKSNNFDQDQSFQSLLQSTMKIQPSFWQDQHQNQFKDYQVLKKQEQEHNRCLLQKLLKQQQELLHQKNEDEIINQDIQCDGCFAFPIKGTIYKCLVCKNYDLCSQCEQSRHQYHPLLKITRKGEYPQHLQVLFSQTAKRSMKIEQNIQKTSQQSIKRSIYQRQNEKQQIKASDLKSKTICDKNFLAHLITSPNL